jgi:hypothetical protein
LKLKVLYVTSSVGLGHVTRDYRLSRLLSGWADITWLTAGRALEYLRARGERFHDASQRLRSIGTSLMHVIKGCRVTYSPLGLLRVYSDLRHNADVIRSEVDLGDYDIVIGDEPWELMMSGLRPSRRSVLITDITSLGSSDNFIMRRVNSWVDYHFRSFTLRFNVGLWDRGDGYLRYGQIFTHDRYPDPSDGDSIVVNLGGTDAGVGLAGTLYSYLDGKGLNVKVIGSAQLVPDPTELIARAKALVTLAGYGSLVEVAALRKRAVILKIGNHFEHEENAKVFEGRPGYRVLRCDRADPGQIYRALLQVLGEEPQPPQVVDATQRIAEDIGKIVDG